MSEQANSYASSAPIRRKVGRPRKQPVAQTVPIAASEQVQQPERIASDSRDLSDRKVSPLILPSPPVSSPETAPAEIAVSISPAITAGVDDTHFRCAKCKHIFAANAFDMNAKGKRIKTCRACSAHSRQYYANKARMTREIDWDTLPIRRHPVYTSYAADEFGRVINLKTRKIIGHFMSNGYILVSLHVPQMLSMLAHRFIYECYHGVITDKSLVVMHGDNNKLNNTPANLTLGTQSQNILDAHRDGLVSHSVTRIGKRAVIAKCLPDGQDQNFTTLIGASRALDVHPSAIRLVCDGITDSARNKTTGARYTFRYANRRIARSGSAASPIARVAAPSVPAPTPEPSS